MKAPYIVGISGGSASGKTLFLNKLTQCFDPKDICVMSQDNYYHSAELQPVDDNGMENFDTPSSIDSSSFAQDIQKLKMGQVVEMEEYTFNNPEATPKLLHYRPAPIIVVEGIYVLYFQEVYALLDLKVFIDAQEHIKMKRRIIRDREERGYDLEDVLYRYEHHVVPSYDQYIAPAKHHADIVVPNNESFERALDVVTVYLKSKR